MKIKERNNNNRHNYELTFPWVWLKISSSPEWIFVRICENSDANALEFLENLDEIFPVCKKKHKKNQSRYTN